MTYPDALAWLYATQLTGIKLGLDGIRRLIDGLGGQPAGARFVHVAGTNGKGSVCALLDSVCRAGGRRSGLYTSPHLLTFRERIRVNGETISQEGVAEGLSRLREITVGWDPAPTFFEYATALALDWFGRQGAEVVAWETGLGGRLDATNAVVPAVCVITEVALDHQAFLGETLAEIAGEKAGIIKAGVPVIVGPQAEEAWEVIAKVARDRGAPLRRVEAEAPWAVGLPGRHQRVNAALALAALEAGGIGVEEAAQREGLASVQWPGRFQRVGDVVLDGAHNPAAIRRLSVTWAEEWPEGPKPAVILGVLGDKDAAGICRELAAFAGRVIVAPVRSARAGSVEGLLALLRAEAPGVRVEGAADFASALGRARETSLPILVTGSLFLVGEALAQLTGNALPEASWQ